MTFCDPANGGIARHLTDQIRIHRDHRGAHPHSRARARRLASGVPTAYYNNVANLIHC
jgi:hypothetical protein